MVRARPLMCFENSSTSNENVLYLKWDRNTAKRGRVSIQSISWRRWAYALRSASRSFSTCCSRPPLTRTNMSNRSRDTRVSFIFSPSAARRSARFTCPELPRLRGLRAVLIQHRQRSTASEWRQQMGVRAACRLAWATYAACTRSSREPFECAAVVCERECWCVTGGDWWQCA